MGKWMQRKLFMGGRASFFLGLGLLTVCFLIGMLGGRVSAGKNSESALSELRRLGITKTYILSGDREVSVRSVAERLSIDETYTELMPEEKYAKLEEIIQEGRGSPLYVGDGINDAPTIARADVGIAMGGIGSDSAIEAADVVITSDNLTKIEESVRLARRTVRISTENIIFALGVKLAVMILGAFGLAGMWLAVFADVGVAALAILNSMRTLR